MKKSFHTNTQSGFTLIETVVAILILSLTVGALLTLTANGIFSVRYARNQIVANNLAQEALEYIRESRDTARQQVPQVSWYDWINKTFYVQKTGQPYDPAFLIGAPGPAFNINAPTGGCYNTFPGGCLLDLYNSNRYHIWEKNMSDTACPNGSGCRYTWYFPGSGFYGYSSRTYDSSIAPLTPAPIMTTFVRTINVAPAPSDVNNQLIVTVTVEWMNGVTSKSLTQSMVLTSWGQ